MAWLAPPLPVIGLMQGAYATAAASAAAFSKIWRERTCIRRHSQQLPLVETVERDHCALPVLEFNCTICEKNGRIGTLSEATAAHISHMIPPVQL